MKDNPLLYYCIHLCIECVWYCMYDFFVDLFCRNKSSSQKNIHVVVNLIITKRQIVLLQLLRIEIHLMCHSYMNCVGIFDINFYVVLDVYPDHLVLI